MGRQGNPEEIPALSSLSEADQKFIANMGDRFPPLSGLTDDEDIVRITAYVLQVNGAKAGTQVLFGEQYINIGQRAARRKGRLPSSSLPRIRS